MHWWTQQENSILVRVLHFDDPMTLDSSSSNNLNQNFLPPTDDMDFPNLNPNHQPNKAPSQPNNMEAEHPMMDFYTPITDGPLSSIVLPNDGAAQFEIRPATIHMLPKLHRLEREDPYSHITHFIRVCGTFRNQNLIEEGIRLRLFHFTLLDRDDHWLTTQPPNLITSWDNLLWKFMNKFYPMNRTHQIRRYIREFRQKPDERYNEAWEHFNELIITCMHHGFDKSTLVTRFYEGLNERDKNMIQSMQKGKFMYLTPTDAYNLLSELGTDILTWDVGSKTTDFDRHSHKVTVLEV